MTLYTSTVRTPPRPPRVWARLATSTVYALALPIVLLIIWGVWGTVAPGKFFPAPGRIAEAFVETWVGPAFLTDVVPSLTRLALAIVLAIAIGVVLGTLIGLTRWLRELAEPLLEFFRAIPPPVLNRSSWPCWA